MVESLTDQKRLAEVRDNCSSPAGDIGSPNDWGQFLDEFRPYLLAIAAAELPDAVKGKFGASDIVQETLLKGLENYGKFQGSTREEFAAWLRTILVNNLASLHRAYRSRKRDLRLEVPADSQILQPIQQNPSEVAFTQEQRSVLEVAMSHLSEEHRETILLRHRENLTFLEIGARMRKSEDAARKTWTRAVKLLKEELQRHGSKSR